MSTQKSIVLLILLVGCLVIHGQANGSHKQEAQFLKNYDILNQYLKDNEKTNKIEPNMEMARKWIASKAANLVDVSAGSLGEVFKMFTALEDLKNRTMCRDERAKIILEYNERGLSRRFNSWDNYPMRRIDRIVQYFALEYAKLCPESINPSSLNYTFKRIVYEHINDYLERRDIEDELKLIAKANKYLESRLAKSNRIPGSCLIEGLSQFIMLQKTLKVDSCNGFGYQTLLKNELAIGFNRLMGGRSRLDNDGPVSRVIHHFAEEHSLVCTDVYPRNFRKIASSLSAQSLQAAEVLANQYLDILLYQTFSSQWFSLIDPKIEREWMDLLAIRYAVDINWLKSQPQMLFNSLKTLAKQDPDFVYLNKVVDPKKGRLMVDTKKVDRLFKEYIVTPCEGYISRMGGDIYLPAEYDAALEPSYWIPPKDKSFVQNFGFYLGHASYQICDMILRDVDYFSNSLSMMVQ